MAPLLKRTRSQVNALALNRKVSLTPPEEVGSPVWPLASLCYEITKTYDDATLAAQPEVSGNARVRTHRADREAAFIGEVLEVEREESAVALAASENDREGPAALAQAHRSEQEAREGGVQ